MHVVMCQLQDKGLPNKHGHTVYPGTSRTERERLPHKQPSGESFGRDHPNVDALISPFLSPPLSVKTQTHSCIQNSSNRQFVCLDDDDGDADDDADSFSEGFLQ